MIEHRLIERVIRIIQELLVTIQADKKEDPVQVEKIIHFIRSYADRCHHGKEESILFRELGRKDMSPEHRRMMGELIEEHKQARKFALSLSEASQRYRKGETEALSVIADDLRLLIEFYPEHIRKEDRDFFVPVMGYFSPEEKEAMLREGYESDSRLLHEEYADMVKDLEKGK
jgi:hemerythrin-like domain-containing protein